MADKVALRRRAMAEVIGDGCYFVPFCGEGDLAVEAEYPVDRILAIDLDAAMTRKFRARLPGTRVVTGDAAAAVAFDAKVVFADLDDYGLTWLRVLYRLLLDAEVGVPLQLVITDGAEYAMNMQKRSINVVRGRMDKLRDSEKWDAQRETWPGEVLERLAEMGWTAIPREAMAHDTVTYRWWTVYRGTHAVAQGAGGAAAGAGGGVIASDTDTPESMRRLFGGQPAAEALSGSGAAAVALTLGQWSFRALVEAVMSDRDGWRLRIATWNVAAEDLGFIVSWWRSGRAAVVELLLDRSFPRRNDSHRKVFEQIEDAAGADVLDYRLSEVHAKWCLLDREGEDPVVIFGTANWNFARRVEAFQIFRDSRLHAWMTECHDAIWGSTTRDRPTTISKAMNAVGEAEGHHALSTGRRYG